MPLYKKITVSLFIVSLVLLNGCSSIKDKVITQKPSASINNAVAVDLKALSSIDKISKKLANHRVVFVGETHTSYSDHLNQLAVIKALHKHLGKKTSIGLEMAQQPYQSFLDKYIAGTISEKDMLRGIEWYERWKYDFRLYRPIFNYAKQYKIPLVALNIPKELTRRITKVGIDHLSKQERQQLPAHIDRSNTAYINRIKSVFGGHSKTSSKGFNKFLDAQLGWDEGMAFAAVKYLNKNPAKHMVILVGSGHVINYEGIPDRLDRQIGGKSAVVLNDIGGNDLAKSGDYLLFSPQTKLPAKGQFGFGMVNTENNSGVKITMIVKNSAAQKAGIKKGDIIVRLNKQVIKEMLDIRLFAEKTKPGDKVDIEIKRHNKNQKLHATLQKKKSIMSFMRHKK